MNVKHAMFALAALLTLSAALAHAQTREDLLNDSKNTTAIGAVADTVHVLHVGDSGLVGVVVLYWFAMAVVYAWASAYHATDQSIRIPLRSDIRGCALRDRYPQHY